MFCGRDIKLKKLGKGDSFKKKKKYLLFIKFYRNKSRYEHNVRALTGVSISEGS